jgi:DNA-binding transcriptional regulator/RsmH inhibitor MraZ
VDATGRLKLPSRFTDYIRQLPEQTLFATKVRDVARIYVNGAWERQLDKLASDPKLRNRIARTAEALGGDVDLDPQGRVTLPQKLREVLQLENQAVQLRFFEDIITLYVQEQFEEEFKANVAANPTDLERAAELGFDVD